jgi:hypothetical protein
MSLSHTGSSEFASESGAYPFTLGDFDFFSLGGAADVTKCVDMDGQFFGGYTFNARALTLNFGFDGTYRENGALRRSEVKASAYRREITNFFSPRSRFTIKYNDREINARLNETPALTRGKGTFYNVSLNFVADYPFWYVKRGGEIIADKNAPAYFSAFYPSDIFSPVKLVIKRLSTSSPGKNRLGIRHNGVDKITVLPLPPGGELIINFGVFNEIRFFLSPDTPAGHYIVFDETNLLRLSPGENELRFFVSDDAAGSDPHNFKLTYNELFLGV